jgi:RNA polymerase sigma-70 factor, ECF subfamily
LQRSLDPRPRRAVNLSRELFRGASRPREQGATFTEITSRISREGIRDARHHFTERAARVSKRLDRAQVEDLYRRYWFQVQQRCLRILAAPDQANDAAQEVFVRLISHGGDFRGEAEWMTWLYRVATNTCLNRVRDQRRRSALLQRETQGRQEPRHPGPERAAIEREALLRVLDHFDTKTQEIAIGYFLDELDQEEIGQLLSLSRVSVNKRLQKFRARARELLEEEDKVDEPCV